MKDSLFKPHCVTSDSKTFHGDQWVTLEVEVRGSDEFIHRVNGEEVMRYQKPQLDPKSPDAAKRLKAQKGQVLLSSGTISIQAETHPTQFRKIEVLDMGQPKK